MEFTENITLGAGLSPHLQSKPHARSDALGKAAAAQLRLTVTAEDALRIGVKTARLDGGESAVNRLFVLGIPEKPGRTDERQEQDDIFTLPESGEKLAEIHGSGLLLAGGH